MLFSVVFFCYIIIESNIFACTHSSPLKLLSPLRRNLSSSFAPSRLPLANPPCKAARASHLSVRACRIPTSAWSRGAASRSNGSSSAGTAAATTPLAIAGPVGRALAVKRRGVRGAWPSLRGVGGGGGVQGTLEKLGEGGGWRPRVRLLARTFSLAFDNKKATAQRQDKRRLEHSLSINVWLWEPSYSQVEREA